MSKTNHNYSSPMEIEIPPIQSGLAPDFESTLSRENQKLYNRLLQLEALEAEENAYHQAERSQLVAQNGSLRVKLAEIESTKQLRNHLQGKHGFSTKANQICNQSVLRWENGAANFLLPSGQILGVPT